VNNNFFHSKANGDVIQENTGRRINVQVITFSYFFWDK